MVRETYTPIRSVRQWLRMLDKKQETYNIGQLYYLYMRGRRVTRKVTWENFEMVLINGM